MPKHIFTIRIWAHFSLIVALLSGAQTAFADSVRMKNGDVYRADILKEEFGNYVQILLKDGSERRLLWSDVESIARGDDLKTTQPESTHSEVPSDYYPTQMLNDREGSRFELDLVTFSYDTTWQQVSLQPTGGNSSNLNATNRYVRTAPLELNFSAYLDRWHTYFSFLNSNVNANDVDDGSFAYFALTYNVARVLDTGMFFNFAYMSTSGSITSSSISATGSAYGFGPFIRLAAPLSDSVAFELWAGAGINFRSFDIGTVSESLNGNDVAFLSYAKLAMSVSLGKYVSYVGWLDGWTDIGTLSGNISVNGGTVTGNLQDNVYRLRVVPLGLRLKL